MSCIICDLRAVLSKHRVSIEFGCSECSDLYGVSNERMEIVDSNGKPIVEVDGYCMDASDLPDCDC